MMGEEHWLRMLHVRITRQNDVEVLLRLRYERLAQLNVRGHKIARPLLGEQARISADLVVAAAAGVQPLAGIADALGEHAFDGHVDVLVVDVEREVSRLDLALDALKACVNLVGILLRDDALVREHRCVGARTCDILRVELLVDGKRCAEALRELAHALFESA